jgi:hypothetical protein
MIEDERYLPWPRRPSKTQAPLPEGGVTAAIIIMPILGSEVDSKNALTCRRLGAIKEQVDTLLPQLRWLSRGPRFHMRALPS